VRRDTQSVLLVLLGGAVIRISVDDTFLRYVKAWTRPYLLAAGAILVLLGLVSLWRERAAGRSVDEPAAGPASEHGHEHGHGPRVAWLLLLPIFAIFLVAPPALGSYAAGDRANEIAQPVEGGDAFAALPDGDPVTTTLTDYATRAIWDEGRSLTGRHIRLIGFVSPRPGGGFYLTRIVITCCAADARPMKVAIRGDAAAGPPKVDSWLAVTGTYGGLDAADPHSQIPIMTADAVTAIPAPAEPYET
jgi:uncharacterized repeat protein (TIGR03943 family)